MTVLNTGSPAGLTPNKIMKKVGLGDLAIPIFIFTTVAFDEGDTPNAVARLFLAATFVLELLSGQRLRINSFVFSAGLFVAFSAISLTWTVAPESSSARVLSFTYQFASYFALTNLILWRPQRLKLSLIWVILSALAAGTYVILIQGVTFQDERSVTGVIAPGQLAIACASGIAISVYRFVDTRRSWYLAAIVVLGIFLTTTSGRRGFMVVAVFLIAFFFLSSKRVGSKALVLIGTVAALSGAYWLIMSIPFAYSHVGYRLESFIGFLSGDVLGDASVQGRDKLINFGLDLFHQSPLLGNGVDSFRTLFQFTQGAWVTSADNNYVEVLSGLGALGFLAYYFPLAVFLVSALRGISRKGREVQFAIAFALSMASLEFATVSIYSKVTMLMLVLCYMVVHLHRLEDCTIRGYAVRGRRQVTAQPIEQ